jgi:hypothetical protein
MKFGQLELAQKGAHSIALYTILFDKNCSQQILPAERQFPK